MHIRTPKSLLTPAMRDVLSRRERARRPPIYTFAAIEAQAAYAAGATFFRVEELQTKNIIG